MSDPKPPPVPTQSTQKRTLVEEGTRFKGSLISTCPVLVQGSVEGDVESPAVTVSATKQCTRDQLKPGNVILGVELSVEGRVAEVHFNPFHCKLRDSGGSSYTPTFRGCEPRLRDHRLAIDERQTGWVSFELPGSATDLRLVCSQAVADQQNRVLEFDLTER